MKLAMPLEKVLSSSSSLGGELVPSQDLEKKVRLLVESGSEEGKILRERSFAVKAMAIEAWTDGGAFTSFSKMVGSWKQGC